LHHKVKKFDYDELRDTYKLKNVVEAFGAMLGTRRSTFKDCKEIESLLNKMSSESKYGNISLLHYYPSKGFVNRSKLHFKLKNRK
jgi:hypothetical protein